MKYIVRVWYKAHRPIKTQYHEFNELDEAVEYANKKADSLRPIKDIEFDVMIYEATNY